MFNAKNYDDIPTKLKSYTHNWEQIEAAMDIKKLAEFVDDPMAKQIIFDIYFFGELRYEVADKLNLSAAWVGVKEAGAIDDMRLAIEENSLFDTPLTKMFTN